MLSTSLFHRSRAVKGSVIFLGSHIDVNWANNFSSSFSELEDLATLDIFILISSNPFNPLMLLDLLLY